MAAWSLQLSSLNPLLEPKAFLLLSGARPAGLFLLDGTRNGVGVSVAAAFVSVTPDSKAGADCCAANSSFFLPLNSNPFLIFLVMTTSGHAMRIFSFILSSARARKENNVATEYTLGMSEDNVLEGEDDNDDDATRL